MINPAEAKLPQPGYLEAVRNLARDHGALLVFDEVVTGFRLALGGAQEYFGVTPDLTCLSKAMANGMPISALCGRAEVMDVAESLRITVGFGGEALSLAATSACLHEYRTQDVPAHLWHIGALLISGLNAAAEAVGCPVRAGGVAPMPKIDIAGRTERETDLMWTYFLQEAAKRGVLFRRGGLDFVCFSHTEEDVEHSVETASEVFENMERYRDRGTLETACRVQTPVLTAP